MIVLSDVVAQASLAFGIGALLGASFAFPFASIVLARRGFRRSINAD